MKHPLDKIYVTQRFGERPSYYAKYGMKGHNGVDFRTRFIDSPLGRRYVVAVESGVIQSVEHSPVGYGNNIYQKGPTGYHRYAHLTRSYVAKGQIVKEGQVIGLTGSTGDSSGPHLHYGWRPLSFNWSNGFAGYEDPRKLFNTLKTVVVNGSGRDFGNIADRVFEFTGGKSRIECVYHDAQIPSRPEGLPTYDSLVPTLKDIGARFPDARAVIIFYPPNPTATYNSTSFYPPTGQSYALCIDGTDDNRIVHEYLHIHRRLLGIPDGIEYYPADPFSADPNDPGWRFPEQYAEIAKKMPEPVL